MKMNKGKKQLQPTAALVSGNLVFGESAKKDLIQKMY